MPIRTLDIEELKKTTGNKYELLVIMSKRARQIAATEKLELDEKLQYFEGFEDEDEFSFNEGDPRGEFEDTDGFVFEGQDLDTPAFLRRGVRIPI